jgi:hypothetical protein
LFIDRLIGSSTADSSAYLHDIECLPPIGQVNLHLDWCRSFTFRRQPKLCSQHSLHQIPSPILHNSLLTQLSVGFCLLIRLILALVVAPSRQPSTPEAAASFRTNRLPLDLTFNATFRLTHSHSLPLTRSLTHSAPTHRSFRLDSSIRLFVLQCPSIDCFVSTPVRTCLHTNYVCQLPVPRRFPAGFARFTSTTSTTSIERSSSYNIRTRIE